MSDTHDWPEIYRHYCHNLCRHLGDISRLAEQRLMQQMVQRGYRGLRPTWVQVLPHIGPEGTRIVDIARHQGISKQAIGQLVSEIEAQGYLLRMTDDRDQRSRRIALSPRGLDLIRDAADIADCVENEFAEFIGPAAMQQLNTLLRRLFKGLQLDYPAVEAQPGMHEHISGALSMHLNGITNLLEQQLMEAATAKGHRSLKRSFGMVMLFLGESGTRVIDIARIQGVSKQAISQIAQSIEKAGYLKREEDPTDRRSRALVFTPRGKALIRDAVLAMHALEHDMAQLLGHDDFNTLRDILARLHSQLDIAGPDASAVNTDRETHLLHHWLVALACLPQGQACFQTSKDGWQLNEETLLALQTLRIDPASADTQQTRQWLRVMNRHLSD
ncbi:MAG TPA: MarR family transcriptional regulator [Pseudomonadales bacterium]